LAGIELNNLISEYLWRDLPRKEIVSVIGPADPAGEPKGYVVVADSALNYYDGSCDMIVTDLDGPVDKILIHTESIKVVHAHGDNIQNWESLSKNERGYSRERLRAFRCKG